MIQDYLQKRKNLMCVFVLIDSRHPIQNADKEFMQWIGEHRIPFAIIFTKSDKLSISELEKNIVAYKTKMLEDWENLPETFITSIKKEESTVELLNFIEKINTEF